MPQVASPPEPAAISKSSPSHCQPLQNMRSKCEQMATPPHLTSRPEGERGMKVVRLQPAYVGVAAAVCILAATMVDFLTTLRGYPPALERWSGRWRPRRSDRRTSSCTTFSSRRPRL